MRFAVVTLLWLLTTVALAAAMPVVWLQHNVVDGDGYARLVRQAAADPAVQTAAADELTAQVMRLVREHRSDVAPAEVRDVAAAYTAGPSFPAQFAQVNRALHDWLLADGDGDTVLIDVAPMLRDSAFAQLIADSGVRVPEAPAIPVAMPRLNALRSLATWDTWLAVGSTLLVVGCACLTVAVARRRGRALACLGVSALLLAATGSAGAEIGRSYLNEALNHATVDIRQIAGALLDSVEASLHHWLNVILVGGAVLVVSGVIVAMVGGLRREALRAND